MAAAPHRLDIGPRVPRWGNAFLAGVGRAVLAILGWRLDVRMPDRPKFVIIAVPHTSNWDFVVGIAAILVIRVRVRWWVKHTVYVQPWRRLIDWLGGIPIDRGAAHGVVGQTVAAFRREPHLVLALAPEGTRRRVMEWKRGFYHVAQQADVPVALAWFDYRNRVLGIDPGVPLTGDYGADTARMLDFYRDRAVPCRPENYAAGA